MKKLFHQALPALLSGMLFSMGMVVTVVGQSRPTPALPVNEAGRGAETIRLNTSLVVIDTQVVDRKSGEVINGLQAGDFMLDDDSVRQEISHFSQDKLKLSVVLLIDLSGSVSPVLRQIREGALEALNRLKEDDEVAVMAFSSTTQLVQDFTRDRRLVVDRLEQIEKTPVIGQGTSLYQSLVEAAWHMNRASNPTSRRVIVSITDNVAWEYNFSGISEQEVARRIIDSGSMVCSLIVEGALSKTEKIFLRNREGETLYRRRMSVEPFVRQSGGEMINSDKNSIAGRLATLIDHLRTRYSLGYSPKGEVIDGRYHRIEVRLTDEARRRFGDPAIRTRQGYIARGESADR